MGRPRHGYKDYEELLKTIEKRPGWRVAGGGDVHFQILCPCPKKCMQIIATTPKVKQPLRVLLKQLVRTTCWKETK